MEPQAALDAPRFRLEGVDSAVGPASVRTSKCGAFVGCCALQFAPQGFPRRLQASTVDMLALKCSAPGFSC